MCARMVNNCRKVAIVVKKVEVRSDEAFFSCQDRSDVSFAWTGQCRTIAVLEGNG